MRTMLYCHELSCLHHHHGLLYPLIFYDEITTTTTTAWDDNLRFSPPKRCLPQPGAEKRVDRASNWLDQLKRETTPRSVQNNGKKDGRPLFVETQQRNHGGECDYVGVLAKIHSADDMKRFGEGD